MSRYDRHKAEGTAFPFGGNPNMDRPASCRGARFLALAPIAGVLLATSACSDHAPFPKPPEVKESMNRADAALRGERLAAATACRSELPRGFATIDVRMREAEVLSIMGPPQATILNDRARSCS